MNKMNERIFEYKRFGGRRGVLGDNADSADLAATSPMSPQKNKKTMKDLAKLGINRQLKRFIFFLAVFFALSTADVKAQMVSPYGPGPGGVGLVNIGVTQAYPTHNVTRPDNWNENVTVSMGTIEIIECATSTNGALVRLNDVRVGNSGAAQSVLYATGGLASSSANIADWEEYLDISVHDAYWLIIVPSGEITTRRYRLMRDPENPYSLIPTDGPVHIRYPTNTNIPYSYSPTMQVQSYNCTSRAAGSGSLGTAPYGPANEVAICGTISAATLIRDIGNWGANPTTGAFQIGNYVINSRPKITIDNKPAGPLCSGESFQTVSFDSDGVPSSFYWELPEPPTGISTGLPTGAGSGTNYNSTEEIYYGFGSSITFGETSYEVNSFVNGGSESYSPILTVIATASGTGCVSTEEIELTVLQVPILSSINNIEACHNEDFDIQLAVTNETPLKEYKWTVSNTEVGLNDGTSTAPPPIPYADVINYTAANNTPNDNSAVVEVTAEHTNGCISASEEFNIKVRPMPILNPTGCTSIGICANDIIKAGIDLDLVQYNPTPTSMNPSLHWHLDNASIFAGVTPSGTPNGSGGLTGTGNISELRATDLKVASESGTFKFIARIAKTTTSGTLTYCESEPDLIPVTVFPVPVEPELVNMSPFVVIGERPVLVTCIGNVPSIPIETSTTTSGVKFSWKNTATDVIGLPTPQTLVTGTPAGGPPPTTTQFDFPAFTAANSNLIAASANIEVTASITTTSGECSSSPLLFDIKVQPRAQLGDWATPEICSEDMYVPADTTDPTDPALFVFSSAFNAANGNPNATPDDAHFKWEIQNYNPALFGTPALNESSADYLPAVVGYLPAFQPTGITGSTATQLTLRVTPVWEGCDGTPKDYTINLNPLPVVTPAYSTSTVCSGKEFDDLGISLSPNIANSTYEWAIDPTTLPASGSTISTGIIVPASPVSAGPITFGASSNTEQSSYTATLNITATTPVSCTGSVDVLLTINQAPVVTPLSDIDVCAENTVDAVDFSTNLLPAEIADYTWTINNPSVRHDQLAGADSLAMRKFTAKVSGSSDNTAKVTVYATHVNGCQSLPEDFYIKIPTLIAIGSQERCPGETVGPLTLSLNFIPSGLVDLEITWTLDTDDIIKNPSAFPSTLSETSNSLPFYIPSFITADNPDDGFHTPIIGTFTVIGTMTWGSGANEFCNFTNPVQPIVITVNPVPESPFMEVGINWNNETLFCNGETVMETHFGSLTNDVTYSWKQISGDLIGLPLNNLDYIPEFTAVNNTPGRLDAGIAKILITATSEKGCMSDEIDMDIDLTVKPVPQLDVS